MYILILSMLHCKNFSTPIGGPFGYAYASCASSAKVEFFVCDRLTLNNKNGSDVVTPCDDND